jgi:hypothetical protein
VRQATRFDWLSLKTRKQAVPNKNKPGLKQEHTQAILEDESRNLLQLIEQEKYLNKEG